LRQDVPRYRFSDLTLSTRKRLLIRNGQQLPLIPRYLDLLIFLIERRRDAVHRREIFDRVWSDVIVSDSALSQAIRTLRRTLGDDPREPRFIRTVSRHGYQFTFPDVIEEPDEDVPEPVPVRAPEAESETRQKVGASLTALKIGATRACAGAALAGGTAGIAGGLLLSVAPDNAAPLAIVPVLVLVGAGAGSVGGLGVGAGLAFAESSARLRNAAGLTIGAAAGGAAMGMAVQWLMRWSLAALVGLKLPIGGAFEGLVIGAAAGLGYAIARRHAGTPFTRSGRPEGTPPRRSGRPEGTPPRRSGKPGPAERSRVQRAAVVAAICAAGALALSWAGRPLVGGTLHVIAREARGSQISLAPLGRLIGEPGFGPASQALIAAWEGGIFGFGVGVALLRRRSHANLTNPSSAGQDLPTA
jgi:DNA-binding winged helix-turn-helix (wHTH) protein